MKKIEIHFEIFSQCRLSCIHCSSECGDIQPCQYLSLEKISNFVKLMDNSIELVICLTGGEPLLSAQFFPTLSAIKQFSGITQKGFFTSGCIVAEKGGLQAINEKLATRLKQHGITYCYVSLYSHSGDVHDSTTRVKGSYKCSITSISTLLDLGIQANVNFVLMKYNYKEIKNTIYFLNDLGVNEIRFLRLVKHGRAQKNWESIGLDKDEQKSIAQEALDDALEKNLKVKITIAGFPEIWDCRPFAIGKFCQAGIGLYYVDCKGNVFPCACKKKDEKFSLFNINELETSKGILSVNRSFNLKCLQDISPTTLFDNK